MWPPCVHGKAARSCHPEFATPALLTSPALLLCSFSAFHETALERWLYLALACKESLMANQVGGRLVLYR